MPYKNSQDRMNQQKKRRVIPLDTPNIVDTPKPDTPADLIPRIDTPNVCITGLANLISTPRGKAKLFAILEAFVNSHHPENMQSVRLGPLGPTLAETNRL